MKATKQYFHKLVFVKSCKIAIIFYIKNEILNFVTADCVYYAVPGGSYF